MEHVNDMKSTLTRALTPWSCAQTILLSSVNCVDFYLTPSCQHDMKSMANRILTLSFNWWVIKERNEEVGI